MENNQENSESLVDFVQSMVVVKPAFHIFAKDLLEITKKVYGKQIKISVDFNGGVYQYDVKSEVSEDTQETVDSGIFYGNVYHSLYGDILNHLCNKELLEPGNYFIYAREK